MEQGFVKAQSNNLPRVDSIMVASFFKDNVLFTSAEIRGVKAASASREEYGDEAIGYVQLKRQGEKCTVKCKICPEHKVRNKNYTVTMTVDESEEIVEEVQCHNCAASEGGCKHAVAFLMWVHRRSEEPASTSVQCYWNKSSLSKVGTSLKYKKAVDFGAKPAIIQGPSQFFNTFVNRAMQRNIDAQLLKHLDGYEIAPKRKLSLHQLLISFIQQGGVDSDSFLEFCKATISVSSLAEAESATKLQSKEDLWYELRYGRITASRAYEVSRCKTIDGTLVDTIVGAHKTADTKAMARGRQLEPLVLKDLRTRLKTKIKTTGLGISSEYPFIAASADGIADDFTVEIKCPTSAKTLKNYISNDEISAKCKAQVQLQMFVTGKSKSVFCVADPNYEENNNLHVLWISYDNDYCESLLPILTTFWKQNIYPRLYKAAKSISVDV